MTSNELPGRILRRIPVVDIEPGDLLITSWDAPRRVESVTVGELVTVLVLAGFGESHQPNGRRLTVRRVTR